jgi:hypothetical protein
LQQQAYKYRLEQLKRDTSALLPKLHAAQLEVYNHPARFKTLACGRRWGKTIYNAHYLCEGALQGQLTAYFSLSHKNLTEIYRMIYQWMLPEIKRSSENDGRIELKGGGVIEFWSFQNAAITNSRGRHYHRLVLDEAGFIPAGDYVWDEVVRPMLADFKGTALRTSSANGKNHFYNWFVAGIDDPYGEQKSWQFPISSNPLIDPDEIESIRRTTPERSFRKEYLAEFLDDGGEVFRWVRACATAQPHSEPQPGCEYVIGVDLAKLNDYTVFAVIERKSKALVYVDRFNFVDYTLQLQRLQALHQRFCSQQIMIERNIGEMFIEQATRLGLPVKAFQTTASSKPTLIDNLALAFEQRTISIIPDGTVIAELEAYAMEKLPSGTLRYSAPPGAHDDTVIALALAWHLVSQPLRIARSHATDFVFG